uniref:RNase H type-1 domain-containing protein n=1 Tax=Fagus sylvatica TaxID=28930 RepID=A0A2N9H2V5_FAGSY
MGLRGSARVWFNKLELESISSFVQLSQAFIDHFIGGQKRGHPPTHLLSVKQMEGESLRAKGDFLYDLCKDPPETLSELMYEAQKHMNAEDALEALNDLPPKRQKEAEDHKQEPAKQKVPKFSETPERKRTTTPTRKFKNTRPPKPQGPKKRTENPKLGTAGEIRTIVGGPVAGGISHTSRKVYARQVHNIFVVQRTPKNIRLDDQIISFSEENARGTHQPHDDALVITMSIADFTTRRVMIDNSSSTDILYLPAYQQMKLDKEKLRPMGAPLVGFAGDKVSKAVDFLVVDCPSAYNAIIGQPTLNRLRAVTSIYHPLLKFPTEHGIGEVRGDQIAARECYLASLEADGENQPMTIEEQKTLVEPSEELNTIILDDEHPEKSTRIGANLTPQTRESIIHFLKKNKDIFAWSHEDMPGYNQIVMDEADHEKKSFITCGLFCYKVMPFELKNAGATYQQLMNRMFHDQIGKNVEVYIDDMLVKSKEEDDHLKDLEKTFNTLRKYHMKLNPSNHLRNGATKEHQRNTGANGKDRDAQSFRLLIDRQMPAFLQAEFTTKDDEPTEDDEQTLKWTAHINGSSTKNTSRIGIILKSPEGDIIKQAIRLQYATTTNEAEYEALLTRLKLAKILGATELDIRSDSQFIVGQVNGDYEAKEERMQQYLNLVRYQMSQFRKVKLNCIPREQNTATDQLAKLASSTVLDDKIEIVRQSSLQTAENGSKNTNRRNSIRMTYGSEVVVPIEIGLKTLQTLTYDDQQNEEQLHLNLDLIDEVRETTETRMRRYQEKRARHYNTKVKPRQFSTGDLVLRKVTMATKDPTQGKLGPNWEGPYQVVEIRRQGMYHLEDANGRRLPHPWNAEHLRKYYP